jgi:glycine/D-amino acid oxidase-like deaminating enzyme
MLTAPLAAELIADLAFGTPRCLTDELLPFLLPQRFALRHLRRARA